MQIQFLNAEEVAYMWQVQLASAKLAICLKNSVLGFEKLSFLRGLKFSLRPTLRM